MADIASISAVLTGLQAATDIAKWLREANVSLEKAEVKLKLAELMSALADARISAAETRMLLEEKDARIATLQSSLELKAKLVRSGEAYYLTDEVGSPVGDPYCSRCWEVDHKPIHLHQLPMDSSMSTCPACKSLYQWQRKF